MWVPSLGQQVVVDAAHAHRVDGELSTVVEMQDNDLQQVAGAVGAEVQRSHGGSVVCEVVDDQCVLDRVRDVGVVDLVFAR